MGEPRGGTFLERAPMRRTLVSNLTPADHKGPRDVSVGGDVNTSKACVVLRPGYDDREIV